MIAKNLSYDSIVDILLATDPGLKSLYDEHLSDYDELLPHVFFGDLTRYIIDLYKKDPSSDVLHNILEILEHAVTSSDNKLQELVSVSFLENLGQAGESYEEVKTILGENLKKELSYYETN